MTSNDRSVLFTLFAATMVLCSCESGTPEGADFTECMDGLDNDNDGAIDCLDADCMGYGICWEDTGFTELETEESWIRDVEPLGLSGIVINEFMASNALAVVDDESPTYDPSDPSFPDWIELHNTGSSDVDISGYRITDDLDVPDKHTLLDGLVVPAGGYLLLWADDDEEEEGIYHVGFNLSSKGEEIGIYDTTGTVQCALEYGPQFTDISASRVSDGAGSWEFDTTPTADAANSI